MNIETRVHKHKNTYMNTYAYLCRNKGTYIDTWAHAHTADTYMHKYSYAEPRATKSQRPCLSMEKTHHKVSS